MDGGKGVLDSFRVEEAYSWRDDIMGITRRIVHGTDEARLNNIAEHFEVDLSEIREFLKMKQRQKRKPQTKADLIRAMSDEELAEFVAQQRFCAVSPMADKLGIDITQMFVKCRDIMLDWLRQEASND